MLIKRFTKNKVIYASILMPLLLGTSFAGAFRPAEKVQTAAASTQAPSKPAEAPVPAAPLGQLDFRYGFANISEKALPAVVNVATTQIVGKEKNGPGVDGPRMMPGNPFEDLFREFFNGQMDPTPRRVQSLGSGFIIRANDSEAYIVTNHHVIGNAKKISVFLNDKTELEATIYAFDERTDIAVLKVSTSNLPAEKRKLPVLEWGDSNVTRVGEWVLAIGNPFGLGSTLTVGVVSSKGRDLMTPGRKSDYVDDFIQHSAQINMGNSGGCLLDVNGKVIGINTAIFSPSGGNVGIGFAIPSDVAKKTVEQLIEFKRTKRGWLGVRVQHMSEDMAESLGLKVKGAIVGSVTPEGPAEKAGLQGGDVIIKFDGKVINDNNRISRLVGETPIGKECPVEIWRGGKTLTKNVVVGEFEDALQKGKIESGPSKALPQDGQTVDLLGMQLASTPKGETPGVYITRIDPNSPAAESGVRMGDIVTEVSIAEKLTAVQSPKDMVNAVEQAKKEQRKNVLLHVVRDPKGGVDFYVSLRIEDADKKTEKNSAQQEGASDGKAPAHTQEPEKTPEPTRPEAQEKPQQLVPEHPANMPQTAPAT
jgi:serine protease Do